MIGLKTNLGFIDFSNETFKCPYCNKEHSDINEKFHKAIIKNKKGYTTTKCSCNNKIGVASDYRSDLVGFKLK